MTIEYFWRGLVQYLEQYSKCEKYRNAVEKNKIIKSNLLKNGNFFEFIDRENKEFKDELIKEVMESSESDKENNF